MRRKPQPRARTLLKISTEPYTLDSPVIGAPLTLQREKRVETEGVLPGDKLHDGNHLGLSNEQHWALIEICEVEDALSHSALLKVISDISEYYTQFALLESLNPPLYEHKQRLQRTAKLVKKLRPLIETESLLTFFLEPLVEVEPGVTNPSSKRLEAAEWLERCVVAALAKIELNAAFLVKNEKELRRWRLEPDEPSKSAERRFIWERFLKFWSDLGRPVGYSEDGPIIRALRIIHESLEIPAPKGEAIRQVINDFKGRPRASKKKAGKGKHI